MRIRRKSPEELQAQVATFISQGGEWTEEQEEDILEYSRMTPQHLGSAILYFTDYEAWFGNQLPHEHEYIKRKVEFLRAYSEFQKAVKEFKDGFSAQIDSQLEEIILRDDYLGDGSSAVAFKFWHNSQPYALRLMKLEFSDPYRARIDTERYVDALVRCTGKWRTEQLVACSYDDCVTVSRILSGDPGPQLILHKPIPIEHFKESLQVLQELLDLEVNNGFTTSNVLYDEQEGFGFLDMHTALPDVRPLYPMSKRIEVIMRTVAGVYRDPGLPPLSYDAHLRIQALNDMCWLVDKTQDKPTALACQATAESLRSRLVPHVAKRLVRI